MLRVCLCLIVVVVGFAFCQIAEADLLGYWSADSTNGAGIDLPNDQGDSALDGELVEATYSNDGEGHTGQAGDYAIDLPGEDSDYVVIPPTEALFEDFTVTAWVNGLQNGAWAGIVLSRAGGQPIGIDYRISDGLLTYIWNNNSAETYNFVSDLEIPEDEWAFVALSVTPDDGTLYVGSDGELLSAVNDIPHEPQDNFDEWRLGEDDCYGADRNFSGLIDDVSIWDEALTEEQLMSLFDGSQTPLSLAGGPPPGPVLQAGDADMDLDFDQIDLVQVSVAGKYLTREAATWGEGDWDGAPGGSPGDPPPGDGFFNQLDIIAALNGDQYLKGTYWPPQVAALAPNSGMTDDEQTSIVYDANTGELAVNAPAGTELTSINVESAAGIFTGDPAVSLGGDFDNDADDNIFKATFGSSFGSLSFGNVAPTELSEEFVRGDLTVVGSLSGGGGLGDVDLIYVPVPEPMSLVLMAIGLFGALGYCRRR